MYQKKQKLFTVRNMVLIGVLAALAGVLMTITKFPVPFLAPSFYKFDVSEAVVMLGAMTMGPVAGVFIELIKVLINLLLDGTVTAGIGELSNFIMGCAYIIPASLIYRSGKSFKTAAVGVAVGVLSVTLIAAAVNYFLLIPAYVSIAGFPLDAIIEMGSKVVPAVKDIFTLVVFTTIPFNVFKYGIVAVIGLLLYNPTERLINGRGTKTKAKPTEEEFSERS
jgi:riboflavin transporter FmnP